jgi:hypothetical protein
MSKVSSAIINEGLDTEFTLTETIYGDFSYNYDFRIKDKTLGNENDFTVHEFVTESIYNLVEHVADNNKVWLLKCEIVGEFKKLYTRENEEEIITKKTENSFIEIKSLSDYTKNRYKSIDSKGNNILISKRIISKILYLKQMMIL